ncbi:MAG: periplasmic heavy metal sensor, partial [Deltaproteobacteria bacterium]|nr:periplasmic heavy metal sensor [Deltaproteobacteria bacterium]
MPIMPVRVPASNARIRAAPFSSKSCVVFSFSRWILSKVMKVKRTAITPTAPRMIQGGTVNQVCFSFFRAMENITAKSGPSSSWTDQGAKKWSKKGHSACGARKVETTDGYNLKGGKLGLMRKRDKRTKNFLFQYIMVFSPLLARRLLCLWDRHEQNTKTEKEERKMKKTLIVLGSLMLLAAVAYPVFAHGPGWGGGRHMTGPGGYGCPGWGRGYGGPAGEDVAALGKLRQDFVEETRTLREEIRTKSNELDRLLATENPDEERVRSLHKDLSELRA